MTETEGVAADPIVVFLRARIAEDEAVARRHVCALDCMSRIHQDWHRVQHARGRGNTVQQLASMGLGLENVGAWDPDGIHTIHPDEMRGTALDPARVLREVEAKRSLVEGLLAEGHAALAPGGSTEIYCPADYGTGESCDCGRDERVERYLRLLAAVYADHPEFREEWRP